MEKFKQQEAELQKRKKVRAAEQGNVWTLAPQDAYGLKGEDGWTYEIPVTEEVLESILLGAAGRILAVEKDGEEISKADALVYLGRDDPIRGSSMEAMKARLEVVLPKVKVIEGQGGHNMEQCEEETAREIAEWIKRRERGDQRVGR